MNYRDVAKTGFTVPYSGMMVVWTRAYAQMTTFVINNTDLNIQDDTGDCSDNQSIPFF